MQKHYEKNNYNDHQNFLYNRALYGLSVYSEKELQEMSLEKKQRVIKLYKKAQKVINLWKQEIVNILANKFFMNWFPDMEITKCFIKHYGIAGDPEYVNNMSFKMLKITKKQIIDKLIETKVLPKVFYELNTITHESRNNLQRRSIPINMSRDSNGGRNTEGSSKTRKRSDSGKINSCYPKQVIR
jgi:hypothetical protein